MREGEIEEGPGPGWWRRMALGAVLVLTACQSAPTTIVEDRLVVRASTAPIADLAARIGGSQVRVTVLVPQGAAPASYEPDERELDGVDLLLLDGARLEPLIAEAMALLPEQAVRVAVGEVAVTDDDLLRGEDGVPVAGLWMTPTGARAYAAVIKDALARTDPAQVEEYQDGFEELADELDRFNAAVGETAAGIPATARMLSMDPGIAYPADTLGLKPRAIAPFADPSAPTDAEVRATIKAARSAGARTVVANGEPPRPTIRRFARAQIALLPPVALYRLPGSIGSAGEGLVALQATTYAPLVASLGGNPAPLGPFLPLR